MPQYNNENDLAQIPQNNFGNQEKNYVGEEDDDIQPEQENSDEMEDQASPDGIERTKNFNQAYDKLIQKFYHEEGANLLIPQEDMVMHEYNMQNRVVVDVEDQQRRIRDQARRKEEKIR